MPLITAAVYIILIISGILRVTLLSLGPRRIIGETAGHRPSQVLTRPNANRCVGLKDNTDMRTRDNE